MCLSGIYKIENKLNGKVYIGQSMNIEQRWKTHLNSLRRNKHQNYSLQEDYNTFTEDAFKFSVIKKSESKKELYIYESYYVDLYKGLNRELYNIKNLYSYNDIMEIENNIDSYQEDLKRVLMSIPEFSNEDKSEFKMISINYINNLTENIFDKTKLNILISLIDIDYIDIFKEYNFNLYGDDILSINYTPLKLVEQASRNHNYMRNICLKGNI